MPKISKIDDNTFEVTVTEAIETRHIVTVDDNYYKELTEEHVDKEKLVEETFNFLLSRESNAEILPKFELQTVERYFPEFPQEMRNLLV